MEIGGLVIAAVFVSLLATVPQLVERRMAIVESREIDRFSPSLRMIHMDASELDMCDRATGTILARRALTSGGSMHTVATGRTRPVIDRRNIRLSETSPGCARAVLLAWPLRSLPAVAAW